MGKREVVKLRGIRPSIRMNLDLRGGRKSGKRILPSDVDGFTHGIRLSLAGKDAKYVPKSRQVAKYAPKSPHPKRMGRLRRATGTV